jgi:hypothetical protein
MALTDTVSNTTNTSVSWTVAGIPAGNSTVGTISSAGVFTAPQSLPVPATVVVQATSMADITKTASASITITSDISIAIAPLGGAVELGAQQNFAANITSAGKPTTAMNWTLLGAGCSGTACGTVTPSGVFTAPQILPSPPTVLLTAASVADPSKSASVPVTVTSNFTLSVSGPSPVAAGSTANFAATLTPVASSHPSATINWSVSGTGCTGIACGTISGAGAGGGAVYTAPPVAPSPDQITITATPLADPSKAASITIVISAAVPVNVTVLPNPVVIAPGATQQFTAAVSGTANQQVTWSVASVPGSSACSGAGFPCGTIDASGLYQAPPVVPSPDALNVIATSAQNPASSAAATVTIGTGPAITLLAPLSATAGAAGGFVLDVQGANFAASAPGPGSTILIGGVARNTLCDTAADCTTTLAAGDLAIAGNLGVTVQNPGGLLSNAATFVIVPATSAPGSIPLTPGAPSATGENIIVVDLSTNGSGFPPQDVSLSLVAIGNFTTANNTCTLNAGPIEIAPPVSGAAAVSLCALSISGLDTSDVFTLTGPSPGDIGFWGDEPLGLGIIYLQLEVPSAAQTGARSLFVQNANLDMTAATGALDVQ